MEHSARLAAPGEGLRIYFAPMEGITGRVFRDLHRRFFGGVDRYYTPFLSPTGQGVFSRRELREVLPGARPGVPEVPQLLTCRAEDFLWAARTLGELGYSEVNLNLGCPSGTVTAKGKGAGFLARPEQLERFLDTVFDRVSQHVSIKTRLGVRESGEFYPLLELYNRYPLKELTVHARVREEFYRGPVHGEALAWALAHSRCPVCCNGDLATVERVARFRAEHPEARRIMIGRGLVADPSLGEKLRGELGADRARLRAFHDALYEGYCQAFGDRRAAMMRMKEYWSYHLGLYAGGAALRKSLRKAADPGTFAAVTAAIFDTLELLPQWTVEPPGEEG